ncbi:AMP-binding protein [Luteimonas sp. MC1572]|uniref:class I adenylate-forming enzyme family protein n=1 Tax=Luteimonas sp. MC1572 TaxID=2799325 RepID=UPI0018F0D858|nr:AMP-binding protein [Luteimonas sp. MC1572]MBJ6982869.1 AMP-binding protein [Luteimonas sp. MC1572]QQO04096.1 AMP-binding protein [Luteimonas sp. MC1572]
MTARCERWLARAAAHQPGKSAIVRGDRRVDYAELHAESERFAAALAQHVGLEDGERCVVFMDNSVEAAVGVFGTLRAGGVFSVINPTTKADKLAFVLADCGATVLLTQASLLPVAQSAAARAPSVRCIVVVDADGDGVDGAAIGYRRFLAASDPACLPPQVGIDTDLAMLVYTSGSTGNPKGVMMTHANVRFAATSITTYLQASRDDVVLSVLPLAFDYGLYQLLMCVKLGATLVLETSFAFPQKVLPLLASERVTAFPLVPTMAALIVQLRNFDPAWAASVRYLTNTAAALPPAHIRRLQDLFPAARVYSMYGMTESKRCTWLPPEELARRPESVGIAIPGTQAWVADDAGRPLPAGEVGELVVRGGHVMQGYWNNAEATARALRPGRYPWERVLHTGDLFRMDAEGFLYFVGRKDDILKSRGEKVSPKEVENVLYAMHGVREAALVGVPDPVLGHALKALLVVDDPGLDARAVIAHCRAHLEEFMVPRTVEFRESLPKTGTGKIRRSELQAEAEGRQAAEA